ncbi:MAG: universal stress protein [Microvirga sp.]
MKNILVPIEDHSVVEPILETALWLGHAFESYIEGIAITSDYPVVLPVDIAIGVPSPYSPENRSDIARACHERFDAYMLTRGIPRASAQAPGFGFNWRQGDLVDDAFLGGYGRVFDVTVVGRPDGASGHTRLSTVEAALFETGRPVIVAPPVPPASIGETVVIAWNRSTETARSVQGAMPLLARAKRIVVLELEGWGTQGPSGAELARALRMHGMNAETLLAHDPSNRPGEAILSEAAAVGCDLLVKGAYTQSRLRQMFFGGATSHILGNTTIPVLLAH